MGVKRGKSIFRKEGVEKEFEREKFNWNKTELARRREENAKEMKFKVF